MTLAASPGGGGPHVPHGFGQHFGPTNVTVWRVAIGAETAWTGVALAESVQRCPIDLDVLNSTDHLDTADRLAPQRIRHDLRAP